MRAPLYRFNESDFGPITLTGPVPAGTRWQLISVSCNFATAPTTAEDFTITLDSGAGAPYDLRLYTVDPGTTSTSDILWQPDQELYLENGDAILVEYDNTDGRLHGTQITFRDA